VSFADRVFDTYRQRVEERVAYVETLLKTPFDFSVEETYRWKRRDAPWPADVAAQNELWRRRLKNEVLSRIISQELKAKKKAPDAAVPTPPPVDDAAPEVPKEDGPKPPEPDVVAPTAPAPEATTLVPETDIPGDAATKPAPVEAPEDIAGATQAPETPATPELPPEKPLTNEEFVLKRYRQFLTMLEDSDAEHHMSRYLSAVTMAFDPHTAYLSPVSLEDFGINMQLSLQGIGAQLQSEDGTAKIEEIIPGGPADRDTRDIRLVKGDRIIGVGQGDEPIVDTLHWPLYKAVRLIRGPKGTKVVLLVQPASDPSGMTTKRVDLIRDDVRLEEQAATSRLETTKDAEGHERRLGTIRLPTFYASMNIGSNGAERRSASLDIARLLADLNSENVEGLILDLRSNGGGALKEAIDLAGLFIRTGPVVLVKERSRVHTLLDQDPAIAFRKPMVVLIDRISASASEIVAGALQDYGRAVVVGDSRSHGKGTVQQILSLGDEGDLGSLKVTNASFFRINGSSTQVRGVASDVVLPSAFDFFAEMGEDKLPNAIPWSTVGSSQYRTVATLGPTIEALKKRSEKRLADDARWQKHLKRMQRIEHISNLAEVPLQIDQRRAFARDEQALEEIDEQLNEEGATRKDREEARRAQDVVLDEALRILVDLIDVHGPLNSLQQTAPSTQTDSLFDRFFR
jgi:carboxyl-terminal processing protease